jgi:hypothetical protein
MSGINQSKITVTLQNPLNYSDQLKYYIIPNESQLAKDWVNALKGLLSAKNPIEKNFCFMGFPKTQRNLEYLCSELNRHVDTINKFFGDDYTIDEIYTPVNCVDAHDQGPNHEVLNILHNHFERLQGTVWELSSYYKLANYETKYAIRQLNNICHEIENLILSQRKLATLPYWVRPSQITTFLNSPRLNLTEEHRQLFSVNGYDRVMGGVYMHWTQIGKTLYEVFRDEGAPELTDTVCEAITELQFYSGEFDIEWGNDVVYGGPHPWHNIQQDQFRKWLADNGRDYTDPQLSLGYLPIGQVDLLASFGTTNYEDIWDQLSNHLDIYSIEVDGVKQIFDYCWSDSNYAQKQIEIMRPGYDHSSRR